MIEKKYYTGVGSRQTPKNILLQITDLSKKLYTNGWILRSGNAGGADTAFALNVPENGKEIYLPWPGFNNSKEVFKGIPDRAFTIASQTHPAWHILKDPVRKLHARNVMQVLGEDLNTPSDFLICWTERGLKTGGTATAIRIAEANNIPVFNLFFLQDFKRVLQLIDSKTSTNSFF